MSYDPPKLCKMRTLRHGQALLNDSNPDSETRLQGLDADGKVNAQKKALTRTNVASNQATLGRVSLAAVPTTLQTKATKRESQEVEEIDRLRES